MSLLEIFLIYLKLAKTLNWLNNCMVLYMYKAHGQGKITPGDKEIFQHFEWGRRFDLVIKMPKVILRSSNLVYLESQMLYTKIQSEGFLVSGEEDF